jgi:uncharacterized membrane protein YhiD involved in acid resistance
MNKLDLAEFLSSTSKGLSYERITFNMLMTLVLVIFIYWVYKKTYSGVMYSKNFNITIMLISTVTAMVMMVIGSNLALSLGMVGALSIIRFRAAIKDPKDIGFLFWGIAVGLSAGTGSYGIALIGSIIIAIILFVFNIPSNDEASYLLIIKGNDIKIDKVTEIIKKNVPKYKLRMKSTNPVSQEIIYEVNLRKVSEDELMKELKKIKQISTLNIVSHNGEVAGN